MTNPSITISTPKKYNHIQPLKKRSRPPTKEFGRGHARTSDHHNASFRAFAKQLRKTRILKDDPDGRIINLSKHKFTLPFFSRGFHGGRTCVLKLREIVAKSHGPWGYANNTSSQNVKHTLISSDKVMFMA